MAEPTKQPRPQDPPADPPAAPQETGFRKWAPLLVLSLALAIIIIDTTLLNVSLETLIRELHTTLKSLQWVISAYSLTLAALTVTGGRLGDLFGRRRMFRLGATLFAVGSFIASISHSVPVLILGESIIEGIGAALMMPATASLLVAKYRGHDRALAFGVWGGIAAAAAAVGPILGGYLTTHYSWRWGFRINVAVVALLLLGSMVVSDEPSSAGAGSTTAASSSRGWGCWRSSSASSRRRPTAGSTRSSRSSWPAGGSTSAGSRWCHSPSSSGC